MKILDHSLGDEIHDAIVEFAQSKGFVNVHTADKYEAAEAAESYLNDEYSNATHCYMMNMAGDWGFFQYIYTNEIIGEPKVIDILLQYIIEGKNKRFAKDCLKLVKKYIINFDYEQFQYAINYEIVLNRHGQSILIYEI